MSYTEGSINDTQQTINDTTTEHVDLTVESRLLAVVLLLTLLVAISLLISFYTEIAGKGADKNLVTGILLGSYSTFYVSVFGLLIALY